MNFISNPPRVSVRIISDTVDIMALIPPRVSKASTLPLPVLDTNPDSIIVAILLNDVVGFSIKIITIANPIFNSNVGMAGIFRQAQANITKIGRTAHQVIEKWVFNVVNVALILPMAFASDAPFPMKK